MGKRKKIVKALKEDLDVRVFNRDRGLCFRCLHLFNKKRYAWEVHELISKSHWATPDLPRCLQPKNAISICRECHNEIQGIREHTAEMFRLLEKIYGYDYSSSPFNMYMNWGENE